MEDQQNDPLHHCFMISLYHKTTARKTKYALIGETIKEANMCRHQKPKNMREQTV